ncbi:MAG: hypothetical protein RSF67_08585 [Clostridia bacterium]
MAIRIDFNKEKNNSSYKTIYMKDDTIVKIENIAKEYNTSFNSIITKMVEYCIKEGF